MFYGYCILEIDVSINRITLVQRCAKFISRYRHRVISTTVSLIKMRLEPLILVNFRYC